MGMVCSYFLCVSLKMEKVFLKDGESDDFHTDALQTVHVNETLSLCQQRLRRRQII